MSLNIIFHISNFHDLKIVNNIFIFEGGLIFLSREGVCVYVYIYIYIYIYIVERMYVNNSNCDS